MVCNIINNFNTQYHYNHEVIENIILKISTSEDKIIESINFILSDDNHLNDLKIKYFNKDQYTDVIAFNLEGKNQLIDGEIYISMDRVIENASTFNCTISDELKIGNSLSVSDKALIINAKGFALFFSFALFIFDILISSK